MAKGNFCQVITDSFLIWPLFENLIFRCGSSFFTYFRPRQYLDQQTYVWLKNKSAILWKKTLWQKWGSLEIRHQSDQKQMPFFDNAERQFPHKKIDSFLIWPLFENLIDYSAFSAAFPFTFLHTFFPRHSTWGKLDMMDWIII